MKGSRISGWLDLGSLLVLIVLNIQTNIFIPPQIRIVLYPAYFLFYFLIILGMISSFFEWHVDNKKMGRKNHHFVYASPEFNFMFLFYFPLVVILILLSGEGFIDAIEALILFVLWTGSEILALVALLVYSEELSIIEWEKEELRRERKKFRQEIKSDKKYAKIDAERMERWKAKMLEIDCQ